MSSGSQILMLGNTGRKDRLVDEVDIFYGSLSQPNVIHTIKRLQRRDRLHPPVLHRSSARHGAYGGLHGESAERRLGW
jgi:hypothetical protein